MGFRNATQHPLENYELPTTLKPNLLSPDPHPGFSRLKSQPNVFRCRLRPELNKKDPNHSDYAGVLQLSGGEHAFVLLWVHADSSLGLRFEMMNS